MPAPSEAQDALSRHFTAPATLVRGPVHVQAGSRIYYVEHPAFPVPVALKICLRPYTDVPDAEEARQQYDALRQVHESMGESSGFGVPRPFYSAPEEGLIILEWIEGQSLSRTLGRFGSSANKRMLMERAGAWLRHFHEAHRLPAGPLDVEEKLASLAQAQTRHPITHEAFQSSWRLLQALAPLAATPTLRRSWIHGDFKTDNLIISGPRTLGIDIHVRHENACIHDVASFLNRLDLHCGHPGNWPLLPFRKGLCQAFLDAYGAEEETQDNAPALLWLRLYSLLSLWNRLGKRHKPGPALWYLQLTFQQVLRPLVQAGEALIG